MTEVENSRKSGTERLAETRARLLEAVVDALADCGYSGTTTTEVARRSGLTRGAQLHHFGTKDHMMLAAVEHLTTRNNPDEVVAILDQLPPDRDRIRTVLQVLAQLSSGPAPSAYAELWSASRSRPDLADSLHAADATAREAVRALFGAEILERAGTEFDALLDLTLYALRGMAIDAHLTSDEEKRTRIDLILGLSTYFEHALTA